MEDVGEKSPLIDSSSSGYGASEAFFLRHWNRWIWKNGPLLVLLSATLFTASMVMEKLIVQDVSPFELLFMRGIIMCTFSLVKAIVVRLKDSEKVLGKKESMILLTFIGLAASSTTVTLWFAMRYVPLADVSAVLFSNTVVTSTLAFSFCMEIWSKYTPLGVLLSVVGVVMVTKPPMLFPNSKTSWTYQRGLGLGLALISAIMTSLIYFLSKGLGREESAEVILLWQSGIGLVVSGVFMLFGIPKHVFSISHFDIILLFLAALLDIGAWVCLYRSVSLTSPTVASVLGTFELVGCYVANIFIFGEPFSMISILGGFFIGVSSIIVGLTVKSK